MNNIRTIKRPYTLVVNGRLVGFSATFADAKAALRAEAATYPTGVEIKYTIHREELDAPIQLVEEN